jgi:UDP-glucose 6-dehydrogenase
MLYPDIEYVSAEKVLESDATLIVTEWDEFANLNYRNSIVIDGRKIEKAREARIYEGICW